MSNGQVLCIPAVGIAVEVAFQRGDELGVWFTFFDSAEKRRKHELQCAALLAATEADFPRRRGDHALGTA